MKYITIESAEDLQARIDAQFQSFLKYKPLLKYRPKWENELSKDNIDEKINLFKDYFTLCNYLNRDFALYLSKNGFTPKLCKSTFPKYNIFDDFLTWTKTNLPSGNIEEITNVNILINNNFIVDLKTVQFKTLNYTIEKFLVFKAKWKITKFLPINSKV